MKTEIFSESTNTPPSTKVSKLITAYARGENNGRWVYASQDREMGGDDPSNEADRHHPPYGNTTVVALGMVLGLDES